MKTPKNERNANSKSHSIITSSRKYHATKNTSNGFTLNIKVTLLTGLNDKALKYKIEFIQKKTQSPIKLHSYFFTLKKLISQIEPHTNITVLNITVQNIMTSNPER